MFARIPGHDCVHRMFDHFGPHVPVRTPGSLGHTDAADPNLPGQIGDTPGTLGHDDVFEDMSQESPAWLDDGRQALVAPAATTGVNLKELRDQIARHEERPTTDKGEPIYWDVLGRPTVGIGFALDRPDGEQRLKALGLDLAQIKAGKQRLSEDQTRTLFEDDVRQVLNEAGHLVANFSQLPEEKQRAVADMVFQLGAERFRRFTKFIQALEAQDFQRAAEEMKASRWYEQAGQRGRNLVEMMRRQPQQAVQEQLPLGAQNSSPLARSMPLWDRAFVPRWKRS
jgi:GH24 family phage-related lysozyme (muramidase)